VNHFHLSPVFNDFLLAFIPIFVAVDVVGILPIFVSLTHGLEVKERRKIIGQSLITALCLAFAFIFLGKGIFKLLGISIGDFMVAGGIVLFCFAMIDLINPGKDRRIPPDDLGIVPIGTPLIVGPAVLTTSLMLVDQLGIIPTASAIFMNIMITGFVLWQSESMMKILGQAGSRVLSRTMALLLSAIAVMMIRRGISFIILSS